METKVILGPRWSGDIKTKNKWTTARIWTRITAKERMTRVGNAVVHMVKFESIGDFSTSIN